MLLSGLALVAALGGLDGALPGWGGSIVAGLSTEPVAHAVETGGRTAAATGLLVPASEGEPPAERPATPASEGAPPRADASEAALVPSDRPVPILMYHVIADPQGPWPELYVKPEDFALQMNFLRTHGFHALTLSEVLDAWAGLAPLPRNPIVITFDDGYESTATVALPILERYGQRATLFLQLGLLDRPHAITTAMVERWIAAGMELGDHTTTHPDLRKVSKDRLEREVAGSRSELSQTFHVPVRTFAYPSGRFDERTLRAVREAGFEAAVATRQGLAEPGAPLSLRRIRVDGSDGLDGFVAKLAAWLGTLPPEAPRRSEAPR